MVTKEYLIWRYGSKRFLIQFLKRDFEEADEEYMPLVTELINCRRDEYMHNERH